MSTKWNLKEALASHVKWLKDPNAGTQFSVPKDANLSRANLSYADLSGADLSFANLSIANLSKANLSYADLSYADLSFANLNHANLSYADLRGANLSSANLSGADLSGASLSSANLSSAELPHTSVCPEEGAFIGFKKVQGAILKLRILTKAERINSYGSRKCRASAVQVLAVFPVIEFDTTDPAFCTSLRDSSFKYEIQKSVTVTNFDNDKRVECAAGIHFFMTRKEAEEY